MTKEAENTDENNLGAPDTVEETANTEDANPPLLSTREALEVAINAHKDDEEQPKTRVPKRREVVIEQKAKAPEPAKETFHPPAEYSEEEKRYFLESSPEQQKAAIRLHKSRMKVLEEIKAAQLERKREEENLGTYKRLVQNLEPYIRARGLKESPEVAVAKALEMWREFEDAKDPRQAAAAYLQAKKIDVPEDWLNSQNGAIDDKKIEPLQREINELKSQISKDKEAQQALILQNAFKSFEAAKNEANNSKYPDINSTESGLRLSASIGTLVTGRTELSKQFIASCQSRIPDLTAVKLIEEAYKYLGGKIDESAPITRSKEKDTNHIERSNRAALSVPGRSGTKPPTVKKYKTRREALAAALADLREAEGN